MVRKQKKLKVLLFVVLGSLALLVFLAPYILSTRWGFSLLPIKAEIKDAHFTWLGPQVMEEVKYSKKGVVFFAPEVKSESSLWSLMFKRGQVVVENGQLSYGDIHLEKISLNAHKESNTIAVQAKGDSRQGDLVGSFSITATIQEDLLDIQATFANLPVKGTYFDPIGPSVNLDLNAKITPSIFDIALNLNSEKASASLQTETNPGYISLKAPAVLNALGASVTISELNLPFTGQKLDFAAIRFKADGTVKGVDFHMEKEEGPTRISSIYTSPHLKTPATINGVIEKFDPADKIVEATFTSPLIDTELFPIRNMTAKVSAEGFEHIMINIQSSVLNTQIHGSVKNEHFFTRTPTTLDLTLSPDDVAALQVPKPLSPALFKVVLEPFSTEAPKFKGHLVLDKLSFQNDLYLEGMEGRFTFEPKRTLSFSTSSEIRDPSHPKGSVSLDATMDLAKKETNARVVVEDMRLKYLEPFFPREMALEPFIGETLSLNAQFAGTKETFSLTLNVSSSQLSIKAQIQDSNGSINANIYSPHARFSLNGELVGGMLHLKDTLHAQLTFTDEMSKLFLKKVNPLSISSISSKHPLTLEISPNGTSIPIYPFSIDKLTLPDCKIELGQIECKNEGNINIALSLLKAKQLSTDNLNLWFAPAIVHINQGVINLERTEILIAETYDVALWGKLNLVSNEVKMVLGLTANCLKKAFGIKKLPEDYVLHIPMRGTTDHVKINTKKATLKIAALLAWQQKDIGGAIGGGVPGAVLGGIIDKVVPLPDQKAKTPPAKHPFPWETGDQPVVKKKKTSTKSIKPTDKPAKQLFKILLN